MSRRPRRLLALALTIGLGGCHVIDHKYWSCTVSGVLQERGWPGPLLGLALLLCDLPIYPFTIAHDVYAFFALPDRGNLPGDAPAPGVVPPAAEPPPRLSVRQVEPTAEAALDPIEVLDEP